MEHILQGFATALQLMPLLLVVVGVLMGILIGAMPGLTATMGVTLLLPFTLQMGVTPEAGMAMLIGIYIGAIYGGSISAVLISTPGTPASAATVLDGYPMTKNGEAGRAITLATCASFAGGMISALILMFLSPQLSKFALRFSFPEYFALAVFGLSMIASISGKDVIKGIAAGIFGLLISTVGLDPIQGVPRFSFDKPELYEGIGFIPTLIGLFAISQALYEMVQPCNAELSTTKIVYTFSQIKEFFRYKITWIRSALIGTFIGSLPGAGCDIAAFVSYNEAKRFSKHPEKLGTGMPEGVIAPEAANNGATGGAMIPMLTLGVPGDAVTAVMLGALTVQGLEPGPLLFRDHPETVYPIFASFIIANLAMITVGFFTAKMLSRVVLMDKRLLMPMILILSMVGAYAIRFSMFDVWVAVIMGAVGYVMKIRNFPTSPIVLALILGPMAESNFRRSMLLPDADALIFFTRPIACVMMVLSIITITAGLWSAFRQTEK